MNAILFQRKAFCLIALTVACGVFAAEGDKLWDEDGLRITHMGTSTTAFEQVSDGLGGMFFIWEYGLGYDVRLQRVDTSGQYTGGMFPVPGPAWTDAVILSGGLSAGNPNLTTDGVNGVIAAWVEKTGTTSWVYKAQRVAYDGTTLWSPAVTLTAAQSTALPRPVLVSDGLGGAFVALQLGGVCHVTHVNSAGVQTGGLNGIGMPFALGAAAADGAGGVIAAGPDMAGVSLEVRAQRVLRSGSTLTAQWGANGAYLGYKPNRPCQYNAAYDRVDGIVVCWDTINTGDNPFVRAQRVSGSGTPLWEPDGVNLVGGVGGSWLYSAADICSDQLGGAFVVWTDWRNAPAGKSCDVYAQRVDADGDIVWTANGVKLSTLDAGAQRYPKICSDRVGGAIATWQDFWGFSENIRACRINAADGSLRWSAWVIMDDYNPPTPGQQQLHPKILFAGDGPIPRGAIISWNDERVTYGNYCQKLVVDMAFPPVEPTNLQAAILPPQIHLTWRDNADNETGYKVQYKRWYRYDITGEPTTWTDGPTLGVNCTSYQHDSATTNYYYKFRVCATNSYGDSAWSNEVSLLVLMMLYWIDIGYPNGSEVLQVGNTYEITWSTGMGISNVTIDYSTDGGSTWRTSPIAASTPNDGSYLWTVPNTLSDNCILRIRDAAAGSPYDLSDYPFRIVPPGPDLTILSLTCDQPSTAVQDTPLNVHCTVKNIGSLAADTFWLNFFPNQEQPPQPGEFGHPYTLISDGLAPGASYTWDFAHTYATPGPVTAYAKADTNDMITEADETNNIAGPLAMQIHEFEYIEDTHTHSHWFGGDDGTLTRNVGIGQSFTLPRSAYAAYAGFKFGQRFDYHDNPTGFGHAVTLVLNIRAANGAILKTVSTDVPAAFSGGWVCFNINMDMWAKQTYIFTCYLQNGQINELHNSALARNDNPWPDSQGFRALVNAAPYDMENWSNWQTYTGDLNVRLAGSYHDRSQADFVQNDVIDLDDFAFFAAQWLRTDCALPGWCGGTDMDYSGAVGPGDLLAFSADWLLTGYGGLSRTEIAALDGELAAANINGSDGQEFMPGTWFVYKTSNGRYGKFIVEKWEPAASNRLTIGWTTYSANGLIYSTGAGLAIRGTFSCDLDEGAETTTDADWEWVQKSGSIRYLHPRNGALFKLIHHAP